MKKTLIQLVQEVLSYTKDVNQIMDYNPKSKQLKLLFSLDDIEDKMEYALQTIQGMTLVYEFECFFDILGGKSALQYELSDNFHDLSEYNIDLYDDDEVTYIKAFYVIISIYFNRNAINVIKRKFYAVEGRKQNLDVSPDEITKLINNWLLSFDSMADIVSSVGLEDELQDDYYWVEEGVSFDMSSEIQLNKLDFNEKLNPVVKIIEEEFDTKVICTNEKTEDKNTTDWYIEPDGSLRQTSDNTFEPAEVITSHYNVTHWLKIIEQFRSVMTTEFNVITNKQTGLHVNLVLKKPIDFVKLIIMTHDSNYLTKFNRSLNSMCKTQYEFLKKQFNTTLQKKKDTQNTFTSYTAILKELFTYTSHYYMDKYRAINFLKYKSGQMIEFRIIGGDYFDAYYEDTISSIRWFIFMMIVASNEEIYKDEYYEKINEMIDK